MSLVNIGNGAVVGESHQTVVALTPGTTVALDASTGGVFTLTPAQAETINATNVVNGAELKLVVLTSGTSAFVLTFGTGFKTTGTLSTGTSDAKVFVMSFVGANGVYNEVSRTAAM